MDAISKARALIAPLKDFTPGPWVFSERNTPGYFWIEPAVGYLPEPHYLSVSGPISRKNAPLIAAAPTLRDTVADLADRLEAVIAKSDALAQENAKLVQRIEALESAMQDITRRPHSRERIVNALDFKIRRAEKALKQSAAIGDTP